MSNQNQTDPRPAAVAFATSEAFALQSSRAATIAESVGRAGMFLSAVSGGLVALGLVATAAGVDSAFYSFALVLLPTLAFVGLVTFGYARRIARLRGYYSTPHRSSPPTCSAFRPWSGSRFRVSGLGAASGFGRSRAWSPSLRPCSPVASSACSPPPSPTASVAAALAAGVAVGATALVVLMKFQRVIWRGAVGARLFEDDYGQE